MSDELPIVNIVGERVALGPMRRDLIPLYQRWVNDLSTMRHIGLAPHPMTLEAEEAWFDSFGSNPSEVQFTIYERETMRPIGNTALHAVDHRNRSAGFGIMIGEAECRGKGYGTEVTRLMLDFAFTALGLHNVMLTVFEFNVAGRRAYEKAGYREMGRRREARFMGGRFWDEIYMDCLSNEFTSPVLATILQPDDPR